MKLSALFEIGRIFLPRTGADELIEQLLLVPEAPHDDLVDALDHAVQGAVEPEEPPIIIGWINVGW
jgi:phage terminase large subunit-like protein